MWRLQRSHSQSRQSRSFTSLHIACRRVGAGIPSHQAERSLRRHCRAPCLHRRCRAPCGSPGRSWSLHCPSVPSCRTLSSHPCGVSHPAALFPLKVFHRSTWALWLLSSSLPGSARQGLVALQWAFHPSTMLICRDGLMNPNNLLYLLNINYYPHYSPFTRSYP